MKYVGGWHLRWLLASLFLAGLILGFSALPNKRAPFEDNREQYCDSLFDRISPSKFLEDNALPGMGEVKTALGPSFQEYDYSRHEILLMVLGKVCYSYYSAIINDPAPSGAERSSAKANGETLEFRRNLLSSIGGETPRVNVLLYELQSNRSCLLIFVNRNLWWLDYGDSGVIEKELKRIDSIGGSERPRVITQEDMLDGYLWISGGYDLGTALGEKFSIKDSVAKESSLLEVVEIFEDDSKCKIVGLTMATEKDEDSMYAKAYYVGREVFSLDPEPTKDASTKGSDNKNEGKPQPHQPPPAPK